MDIQTITGSQKENHSCPGAFQRYFRPVHSPVNFISFPFNNSTPNDTNSQVPGTTHSPPVSLQTSPPLPPVREMLKDLLLGKCEGVRENWKFERNEFSVKFDPEISAENNSFKKQRIPILSVEEGKPETSISNTKHEFTKNFHLQTFNLDELTSVLTNKTQQFSPTENITEKSFPNGISNSGKFPANRISEKKIPDKKKLSDPITLIITEAGFTEKHIPNGRFPIILEEYTEKRIPVGQFEIDFSQTPKEHTCGHGLDKYMISKNGNSNILESVCDIKKRKFSENDFMGMVDEQSLLNCEDTPWKRPKLINNKVQTFYDISSTQKILLSPEHSGEFSGDFSSKDWCGQVMTNINPEPCETERDINSGNINSEINKNSQNFGKNGTRKRVLKMSGRKSWTKMTPKLFSDVLYWERAQGRAVKRTEIESKWNVNRTTYHRWKRNYGIEDTGKSFYLEYCGTNNFK